MNLKKFTNQKYKLAILSACFFIIYLFLFPVFSNAQTIRFGLKASPGLSWMKPESTDLTSQGIRASFNYGIISEFGITENYFFATGIEISNRGGILTQTYDSSGTPSQQKTTYKLQCIDIPLTIKMKTNEIGYISYFGQFGFTPSFAIHSKGDIASSVNNVALPDIKGQNLSGNINPVSVALTIGIGLEYSLAGKTALLVGITFNNGFTDLLHDETVFGKNYQYRAIGNYVMLNTGIIF